jgi:Flp pilus assembly protein TadG
MTHSTRTARRDGERGAAILEVALTLPILLLICVGIFEFGRAYQTWQVVTNAAREGARVSVLPSSTKDDVEDRVKDYLQAGQLGKWEDATVNVNQSSDISIGAANAKASIVTVNYPFSFMVLEGIVKLVDSDSTAGQDFTMSATAEMRNEAQ